MQSLSDNVEEHSIINCLCLACVRFILIISGQSEMTQSLRCIPNYLTSPPHPPTNHPTTTSSVVQDVWSMMWSEDSPDLFAMMEKGRMYIFR